MALIKQAPEEGTPQIKDLIGQRFQMDEKTFTLLCHQHLCWGHIGIPLFSGVGVVLTFCFYTVS